MVVTAATTAATTAVTTGGGRAILGGLVLVMMMATLAGKEVFGYAGKESYKSIQKALTVVAVPLGFAVAVVLVQHFISLV